MLFATAVFAYGSFMPHKPGALSRLSSLTRRHLREQAGPPWPRAGLATPRGRRLAARMLAMAASCTQQLSRPRLYPRLVVRYN